MVTNIVMRGGKRPWGRPVQTTYRLAGHNKLTAVATYHGEMVFIRRQQPFDATRLKTRQKCRTHSHSERVFSIMRLTTNSDRCKSIALSKRRSFSSSSIRFSRRDWRCWVRLATGFRVQVEGSLTEMYCQHGQKLIQLGSTVLRSGQLFIGPF